MGVYAGAMARHNYRESIMRDNMFINYDQNIGITINSYRKPDGYANSDVGGLVDDIVAGRSGTCPLEGALETLEDGAYWEGSYAKCVTPEILEEIHYAIRRLVDI
jgi:hypothetical protein